MKLPQVESMDVEVLDEKKLTEDDLLTAVSQLTSYKQVIQRFMPELVYDKFENVLSHMNKIKLPENRQLMDFVDKMKLFYASFKTNFEFMFRRIVENILKRSSISPFTACPERMMAVKLELKYVYLEELSEKLDNNVDEYRLIISSLIEYITECFRCRWYEIIADIGLKQFNSYNKRYEDGIGLIELQKFIENDKKKEMLVIHSFIEEFETALSNRYNFMHMKLARHASSHDDVLSSISLALASEIECRCVEAYSKYNKNAERGDSVTFVAIAGFEKLHEKLMKVLNKIMTYVPSTKEIYTETLKKLCISMNMSLTQIVVDVFKMIAYEAFSHDQCTRMIIILLNNRLSRYVLNMGIEFSLTEELNEEYS